MFFSFHRTFIWHRNMTILHYLDMNIRVDQKNLRKREAKRDYTTWFLYTHVNQRQSHVVFSLPWLCPNARAHAKMTLSFASRRLSGGCGAHVLQF